MSVGNALVFALGFLVNYTVCLGIKDALHEPFRTFEAYPSEIPLIRLMGKYRYMGSLTMVARGDWIIGYEEDNKISPIFNNKVPAEVIALNIKTGSAPKLDYLMISELGIFEDLPPHTLRGTDIVFPKLPINQSAYPGIYGKQI